MTQPAPTLSLVDTDPAELAVDAIVIGLHSQPDEAGALLPAAGAESIAAAFDGKLTVDPGPARRDRRARRGDQARHPRHGRRAAGRRGRPRRRADRFRARHRRRCAGAPAPRSARWPAAATVALALPLPDDADAPGRAARRSSRARCSGAYRFAGYKTKPQPGRREPVDALQVHVPDAADAAALAEVTRAEVVARAVRLTRDWVNTAPNELRPPSFADAVAAAAEGTGLEVEVLDFEALKAGGYGGIVAVGQGSEAPPRLVKLTYTPAGRRPTRSGSRWSARASPSTPAASASSRPQGMWEMKSDMAGAAAVGATMLAVAALKPAVAVTGYLADGGEHAVRHGVPAGRRHHHVQRQAGRGAQHRRRGPDGARPTRSPGPARTAPTTCSRRPR